MSRSDQGDQVVDTPEQRAEHSLAFAERLRAESLGPGRTTAFDGAEREYQHLRAALEYFIEQADGERAERMVRALRDFWWARGRLGEGRRWVAKALAIPHLPPPTRAAVLDHAGALAFGSGDHDAARRHFEESLAIRRQIGAKPQIAQSLHHLASVVRWGQGDLDAARDFYAGALLYAREAGHRVLTAAALMPLGALALGRGELEVARALYLEGMTIYVEENLTGSFPFALEQFGALATMQGRPRRALRLFGAGAKEHERLASIILPHIKAWVERYEAAARQVLSKAAADAAWVEGQAMTLEQAIAYALDEEMAKRIEA